MMRKLIKFIRRDYLWVLGSILLLVVWYKEKITIEGHRSAVSEYFRKENDIQQMENLQRIYQIQVSQTWTNKKLYDTSQFNKLLVENIINLAELEIDCIHSFKLLLDINKDSTTIIDSVWMQEVDSFNQKLHSYRMDTITNWNNRETDYFASQIARLNMFVLPKLDIINKRLDRDLHDYLLLYFLAGLLLTSNRIKNINLKESED